MSVHETRQEHHTIVINFLVRLFFPYNLNRSPQQRKLIGRVFAVPFNDLVDIFKYLVCHVKIFLTLSPEYKTTTLNFELK